MHDHLRMTRVAHRRFAPTVIGITRNGDRHQIGIANRHVGIRTRKKVRPLRVRDHTKINPQRYHPIEWPISRTSTVDTWGSTDLLGLAGCAQVILLVGAIVGAVKGNSLFHSLLLVLPGWGCELRELRTMM